MSAPVPLLTVPEALEAAQLVADRANSANDVRRAITSLSTSAIVSLAILVEQLHGIAQGAAAYSSRSSDMAAWEALQERLLVAGYLPLREQKDNTHGEG